MLASKTRNHALSRFEVPRLDGRSSKRPKVLHWRLWDLHLKFLSFPFISWYALTAYNTDTAVWLHWIGGTLCRKWHKMKLNSQHGSITWILNPNQQLSLSLPLCCHHHKCSLPLRVLNSTYVSMPSFLLDLFLPSSTCVPGSKPRCWPGRHGAKATPQMPWAQTMTR